MSVKFHGSIDIIENIKNAFINSKYPGDFNIGYNQTGDHLECEQVTQYFSGKKWQDVDWKFIKEYDDFADASACLLFMTPEAFRYYLPAYLIVSINHSEFSETTINKLCPWKDAADKEMSNYVCERHTGFTHEQRKSIILFLEYMRDTYYGTEIIMKNELNIAVQYWKNKLLL